MNAKLKIFSAVFFIAAQFVHAQTTTTQQRPNVTNKALITKATPAKKKTSRQYTIEQFMATTRVGGSAFSADEKSTLFHSNKTGIFNVYSVPVSGGDAKQLTNSTKESTYIVAAFERYAVSVSARVGMRTSIFICASSMAANDLTPGENESEFSRLGFDRQSSFFYQRA
jgi:hypothetical protein